MDLQTPPADHDNSSEPLSVWTTAQTAPASQRKHRYTPDSTAHPAKMLPAIARHAITHYTQPGDLVLDPMCGIGTTLVEAIHTGRHALGVEYEPHWAHIARDNIALAHAAGIDHRGEVIQGDARQLSSLLPSTYLGQAALAVTSPPYGPSTHGQVVTQPDRIVHKFHHRYGNTLDRGNLANIGHQRLLTASRASSPASATTCAPADTSRSPSAPGANTPNSSTCPPRSSPAAAKPDSSPPNAASPSSPAPPNTTSSPAAASSNATSSANNATPDSPSTSSPTKTSSSSARQRHPWVPRTSGSANRDHASRQHAFQPSARNQPTHNGREV